MKINEISHEAGDAAIIECLSRVNDAATDDMLLFRVGGDEFALVTGLDDKKAVEETALAVISRNGDPIIRDGVEIPIAMWAAAVKFDKPNLRYAELFMGLQDACEAAKPFGKDIVFL